MSDYWLDKRGALQLDKLVEELEKRSLEIDATPYREKLVSSFLEKLSAKISKRLAVDEFWVNDLVLRSEPCREVKGESLLDVIAFMESRVYTNPEKKLLALLASEEYEVRIYVDLDKSGIALISPDFTLEGRAVVDRFPGLRLEGEIDEIVED